MQHTNKNQHIPVLLSEVTRFLAPQTGERYLDMTAGYGGHAVKIIAEIDNESLATLVDRDSNAIDILKKKFPQAQIIRQDFLSASRELVKKGEKFDVILADLGVSSPQLDKAERGFSFNKDAPLDMRMDQTAGRTAAELIRQTSEKDLADLIVQYGEEKPQIALKIAKELKHELPTQTIATAEIVQKVYRRAYGARRSKTHPATRTFQALRIAVNDELQQLSEMLTLLPNLLNDGGRVAIITFHSLEDRIVKRFFKEQTEAGYEAVLETVTKKPLSGKTYDDKNRRARSASLRVARKIK